MAELFAYMQNNLYFCSAKEREDHKQAMNTNL